MADDLADAGLAAVVIVSLGVGIGVNTAVFSWIQLMVLQPIPGVADAGGVQLVEPRADTGSFPGASWLEYRDLRDRSRTLPDLFAYRMVPFSVGDPGRPERGHGLLVSGNYFSALGLRPALGRFLRPDEATAGRRRAGRRHLARLLAEPVRRRADVLGRTLRVNDRQLTIVGVTPERFQGTVTMLAFDFWVPATMAPELLAGSRELEDRGQRGYYVAGRLAPRASRAAAQTEIDARHAAAGARLSGDEQDDARPGAAVLAGAARTAAVLRQRAGDPAGHHAAPAAARSAATPPT